MTSDALSPSPRHAAKRTRSRWRGRLSSFGIRRAARLGRLRYRRASSTTCTRRNGAQRMPIDLIAHRVRFCRRQRRRNARRAMQSADSHKRSRSPPVRRSYAAVDARRAPATSMAIRPSSRKGGHYSMAGLALIAHAASATVTRLPHLHGALGGASIAHPTHGEAMRRALCLCRRHLHAAALLRSRLAGLVPLLPGGSARRDRVVSASPSRRRDRPFVPFLPGAWSERI